MTIEVVQEKPRRLQTPRSSYSATVNRLNFTLTGCISNIKTALSQVIYHKSRNKVLYNDLQQLQFYERRIRAAVTELESVQKEIAEWNRHKKWVD